MIILALELALTWTGDNFIHLGLAWVDRSVGSCCVTSNAGHTLTVFVSIEFKEIRKEWKARKKEEENARKQDEDRARASGGPVEGHPEGGAPPGYQQGRSVQLPPIGYQPGAQVPGQYQAPAQSVQQLQEYSNSHLQYSGYPAAPYGTPNQMYSQQRHYTLNSFSPTITSLTFE